VSPPPPPSPSEDENPPLTAALGLPSHVQSTTRDILVLTWPVVLGQIMANAVPLIDIMMLGKLGTPTLAAVGYASQFLTLAQASLMAVGSACVAMMARAIGASDFVRAKQAFAANLWLAMAITAFFTVVTMVWPHELLHMLAVKEEVISLAVPYFRLTLGSSMFMALSLSYEHAFRAAKDTFMPMVIAAVVSVLKVACNYVLIFGEFGFPQMGLTGAGIATVVSQVAAALLFIAASKRHEHPAVRTRLQELSSTREQVTEAYVVALPAVAERFAMNAALMVYFRFLAQYGVEAVAAYNVGVRILAFTWIPGLGLAVAAATLVGQALGAGKPEIARQSGWESMRIGIAFSLVLGVFFVLLRVPMARVFTSDEAVVAALDPFILLLGLALPFLVTHFTLGGALRGAGDTVTPLKSAVVGNWAFRVPLGFLFAELLHLDLFWVWAVMLIDHLARAVWLVWAFHFGSWHLNVGSGRPARPMRADVPSDA
jgi:putative MATE family efflux protein